MPRYYVLHNKTATVFVCTATQLTVTSHTIPVKHDGRITKRIVEALKGGAIREVSEEEYLKHAVVEQTPKLTTQKEDEPSLEEKLGKMSDDELLKYYKANWQVSAKDEKAFLALTTPEKVEFLISEE